MITKEFLTEQGIDESKHEALISAYEEASKSLFTADQLKKEKGDAVRSMMEGFEQSIFSVTQVNKNDNEKASEYANRAFNEFYQKSYDNKLNELSELNKELNNKIKEGVKDPELIKKIEALEQTLENERETFKQEKQTWESENTKREKLTAYKALLPKLKDDINTKYKEFMVNESLNYLLSKEVVEVEGKLLIKGDESNGFTNIQVSEYLEENLKDIISEKHTQTGTGKKPIGSVNGAVLDISDNDSPYDKENKIKAYLSSQGIKSIDPRFSEEFKKLREKYILKK